MAPGVALCKLLRVRVSVGALDRGDQEFCPLLNGRGQIVDRDADPANVHDGHFQRTIGNYQTREHEGLVNSCYADFGRSTE
jgi:hypothetical protein